MYHADGDGDALIFATRSKFLVKRKMSNNYDVDLNDIRYRYIEILLTMTFAIPYLLSNGIILS